MKKNQPKQCERCGDYLSTKGIPCSSDACEYLKFQDTEDYSDDEDYGNDSEGISLFNRNRRDKDRVADEEKEGRESDEEGLLGSIGDAIEDVSDGCIWGTIKFIWKVITFPLRFIWRILDFFGD